MVASTLFFIVLIRKKPGAAKILDDYEKHQEKYCDKAPGYGTLAPLHNSEGTREKGLTIRGGPFR
jgi:hypothetical protein